MVDYAKYKEVSIGEKEKVEIKEIKEGTQGDFRPEEYWANTDLSKSEIADAKAKQAIEIVTSNNSRMVINLPTSEMIHPKSTLAKFKKTYGKYPEEGQEVETKLDQNGFNRLVLED